MSSLIFHTDETQAYIATDTLAVASHDVRPLNFTTKAHIVPHLKMIIAGTGVGGFLDQWFVYLNSRIVTRGIDNVNEHAPRNLAAIWASYKEQIGNSGQTTTVYHFGFSEHTGLIHSYAYRSTNDFRGERLGYYIAAKPECNIPEGYNLPDDIKGMMNEQRKIQAALPKRKRVYIGGEIQIHHLTKEGYRVFTHGRFRDFSIHQKIMFDRFK